MRLLRPLIIILGLVFVLAWASARTYAAWHFLAAQKISGALFESGETAGLVLVDTHLQKALRTFPTNPDFLDLAGQLQEFRSGQPGVVGAEYRQLMNNAAEYYRAAIANRPLWPYSWANLLGAKSRLGEVDEEFRVALSRCADLGPWEPRVQLQVLESGLLYWGSLSKSDRSLVESKMADAVTVRPREVYQLVRGFGRADLLCPLAESQPGRQPQIDQYCASAFAVDSGAVENGAGL